MLQFAPLTQQATIARTAVFRGRGIFSDAEVSLTFVPAEPNTGVVFRRTDLGGAEVRVHPSNLIETPLTCTALRKGNAEIHVVEHLLACLAALSIDNVVVKIDGAEVPSSSGCAFDYLETLETAGRMEQDAPVRERALRQPLVVGGGDRLLVLTPADEFTVSFIFDHPHPLLRLQAVFGVRKRDFLRELIPARTFITEDDAKAAIEAGLVKHNDRSRAVIIGENGASKELIWDNEAARHKAQDIVGDLSVYCPHIKAHIIGVKSGHALNRIAARRLAVMAG